MYEKQDFLRLKNLSTGELRKEYAIAEKNYMDIVAYTDTLEEEATFCFGRFVYALSVSEITDKLSNVERYMSAICTYLGTYEESKLVEVTLPQKKRGIKNVLLQTL